MAVLSCVKRAKAACSLELPRLDAKPELKHCSSIQRLQIIRPRLAISKHSEESMAFYSRVRNTFDDCLDSGYTVDIMSWTTF